jgi:hypothetical protein
MRRTALTGAVGAPFATQLGFDFFSGVLHMILLLMKITRFLRG